METSVDAQPILISRRVFWIFPFSISLFWSRILSADVAIAEQQEPSPQITNPFSRGVAFLEDKLPLVESIDGFARTRHYLRPGSMGSHQKDRADHGKRIEDIYEFRNELRIETDLRYKEFLSGKTSLDLQLDYGVDRDDFRPEEQTFRLFEGYGEFDYKNLNARLGRQVIRWGKADEVNPIDNFTPEDFKEFVNFERADRKLPVLAAYPKYFFSDSLSWEGIWIPFFHENWVAESEQDWELFFRRNYRKRLGFILLPERRPGRQFKNSVWATRFVRQGSIADVSLSYAYHFEQNPTYEAHQDPLLAVLVGVRPPGTMDAVWTRQHSIGSDFEWAKKDLGIRGEIVFTTNKPYISNDAADDDLVERKHTFQSVIGFDYTYKSDNYINLQYTQDFILDHEEAMEPRAYEASITFRLWRKFFHEKLKLQFTGRYYVTDVDFYYKADATYELAEDLEINSGIMIFEGEEQEGFGQFDKNDQLFLNTKYSF